MRTFSSLSAGVLLLLAIFASAPIGRGQSSAPPVERDSQAIAILNQSLSAIGGSPAVAAIQDLTATGNITYYWANQEITGTVTIKERGLAQFRMDATVQNGLLSVIGNNGTGTVKGINGTTRTTSQELALGLGSSLLPFFRVTNALQNTSASVVYVGQVTHDGQSCYEVRLWNIYLPSGNTTGVFTRKDIFIDPNTYLITSIQDRAYSEDNFPIRISHEIQFSNFQQVNGVAIPFTIIELIEGQRTMLIQLDQVGFNSGLTDSDFQ